MNRNFPAGWGTGVTGSGDHPLSEPEIDALVRAIVARPNICGYNAYHTSRRRAAAAQQHHPRQQAPAGRRVGVEAPRRARHGPHRLHGALGVRGLHLRHQRHDERRRRRLGVRTPRRVRLDHRVLGRHPAAPRAPRSGHNHIWYTGPTEAEERAVYDWAAPTTPRCTPTGRRSTTRSWARWRSAAGTKCSCGTTRPLDMLLAEVRPHAQFAVYQALCSPRRWRFCTVLRHLARGRQRTEWKPASPTPVGCPPTSRRRRARSRWCCRWWPSSRAPRWSSRSGATGARPTGWKARPAVPLREERRQCPSVCSRRGWCRAPKGSVVKIAVSHQRAGSQTVRPSRSERRQPSAVGRARPRPQAHSAAGSCTLASRPLRSVRLRSSAFATAERARGAAPRPGRCQSHRAAHPGLARSGRRRGRGARASCPDPRRSRAPRSCRGRARP
jgi:hypothetical protein